MKQEVVKVFIGRMMLIVNGDFHEVELYRPNKKLKKGFGYLKDSIVYIYQGKYKKGKNEEDYGLFIGDNGGHVFITPSKSIIDKYSVENIIELDVDSIFKEIEKDASNFSTTDDIEIINNNAEVFIPTIKEDDDFLKYIVKRVIIDKKINLKNYKDRFTNQYALNNMKSSLSKDTKMTVTNFKAWCEILGINWSMIVTDAGTDKNNPLCYSLNIKSDDY